MGRRAGNTRGAVRGALLDTTSALTDAATSPATSSFSVTFKGAASTPPPSGAGHHHHGGGWGGGWWHSNANGQDDGDFDGANMAAQDAQGQPQVDFNRMFAANLNFTAVPAQAFVNPQTSAAFLQTVNGAASISRLGSFGSTDADLLDVVVPPPQMREAPAPAAPPMPMPNRDLPPAAPMPMQMPMEPDMPIREEITAPTSAAETAAPVQTGGAAGMFQSLVNLIGGAGAFALFGSTAIHSDLSDRRRQQVRDRTRSR